MRSSWTKLTFSLILGQCSKMLLFPVLSLARGRKKTVTVQKIFSFVPLVLNLQSKEPHALLVQHMVHDFESDKWKCAYALELELSLCRRLFTFPGYAFVCRPCKCQETLECLIKHSPNGSSSSSGVESIHPLLQFHSWQGNQTRKSRTNARARLLARRPTAEIGTSWCHRTLPSKMVWFDWIKRASRDPSSCNLTLILEPILRIEKEQDFSFPFRDTFLIDKRTNFRVFLGHSSGFWKVLCF